MNDSDHKEQVMYMLGQISSDVKGVNARLDKVNGRIGKHDDAIDALKVFNIRLTTKVGVIASAISLIGIVLWEYLKIKLSQ